MCRERQAVRCQASWASWTMYTPAANARGNPTHVRACLMNIERVDKRFGDWANVHSTTMARIVMTITLPRVTKLRQHIHHVVLPVPCHTECVPPSTAVAMLWLLFLSLNLHMALTPSTLHTLCLHHTNLRRGRGFMRCR